MSNVSKTIASQSIASWRTPALVIGFGSLIALIAFGPRSTLGFFLTPLSRYLLSIIYFIRAAAILVFIAFPVTPVTCLIFGATMGLMWLSTVPPTNGIIALMFGTRWLATLAGFAFFSHQVGGFLGVWLGGLVFDRTGSYNMVWWLAILFGVLSALINMPIVEKPVARVAAVPA
jgi:predicted MFS family arabinose efflux permease